MSPTTSSLRQVAVLLSAVAFVASTATKCPRNHDCETVDECVGRHGGAARLASLAIFNCDDQRVCCPPVFRNTTKTRRMNKNNEIRKRRMRNRKLFDKHCGKLSAARLNGPRGGINPGDLPWMALLSHTGSTNDEPTFHCGGTLITDRYILTAAHCVQGKLRHNLMVHLGEFDITMDPDCPKPTEAQPSSTEGPAYSSNENDEYSDEDQVDESTICEVPSKMDFSVEEIVVHKYFGRAGPKIPINDIALLRLNRTVGRFTKYIKPVCLPWKDYDPMDDMVKGNTFTIAGWGLDMSDVQSTELKKGRVLLIDFDDCKSLIDNAPLVAKKQTCTVRGNAYACMGDSGGPLTVFDTNSTSEMQLGVVSFSKFGSCMMSDNDPVVYTRVFAYNNWILDSIRPNDDSHGGTP